MLRLMGAPHGCILFHLMRTMRGRPGVTVSRDMTTERLDEIVASVQVRVPDIQVRMTNPEDLLTWRMARYMKEWNTAMWILRQNSRGIAVESGLVWEHFRSRRQLGSRNPGG